jgi:hypothetical protein
VTAIESVLAPATAGLDPDAARWATAVIAHLCSAASWVAIADESGLDDEDAQHAVAWAIDRLVASLPTPEDATRTSADHAPEHPMEQP